jgi:alpha-1,2-mannosyltransferase
MRSRIVYGVLAVEVVLVVGFACSYNALDFFIYVLGGQAVTADSDLYLRQLADHWFTYTPFAATLFIPLSAIPLVLARVLWELASVAAFAAACATVLKPASRLRVLAVVAAGLLLEPVWHTLFLGQINLFLLALILIDVQRASQGRPAGIGIGLAAAIKLTPAIFVVLLLLAGRTRDAARATGTFVLCGLAAHVVAPEASRLYWLHVFYDTSRVGAPYISNQSPFGAILRIFGDIGHWYLLVPLVLGIAGLAVATAWARRHDWPAAAVATGVTGLLVSPISWTHHWVWIMPALLLLVRDGRRAAAACGYLLFVLAPMWFTPRYGVPEQYGFHGLQTLVANSYLAAGLLFLAYLAWRLRSGQELPAERPVLRPESERAQSHPHGVERGKPSLDVAENRDAASAAVIARRADEQVRTAVAGEVGKDQVPSEATAFGS